MPEGPSIVLVKEETSVFNGKKILSVNGNSRIDQDRLVNEKIIEIKSWGKHLLICFKGFTLKIHFLMFGSFRVNEKKDSPVRLNLTFKKGEINFYACSVKYLEGDVNEHYDWTADVMNDTWDPKKAKAKLKKQNTTQICDALLEQDIFSGVGNIIKNEVLYRVRIHPESIVKDIPASKIKKLVDESRIYSFEFLEWKRNYELKKHWLAHTKKICLRCDKPIIKKYTGVKNRRSFFLLDMSTTLFIISLGIKDRLLLIIKLILKFKIMILAIILIIVGIIAVIAVFNAKAKNKDSNGPMNNN